MKSIFLSITIAVTAIAFGENAQKPKSMTPKMLADVEQKLGGFVQPKFNGRYLCVVDAQTGLHDLIADFFNNDMGILYIMTEIRTVPAEGVPFVQAKSFKDATHPSVIFITKDANQPTLSVYPEEPVVVLNIAPIVSAATPEKLQELLKKELWRSVGFALGAYANHMGGNCPFDPAYSIGDLEDRADCLTGMRLHAVNRTSKMLGIQVRRPMPYSLAVHEGWAPAPTNDVQRKIWDKIHAIPQKPLKIEFNEKRDKGK